MRYNLYNESLLQLRCNDLDYTIKASTCTMSKYYSYMFYADRNVRPCMILGYTLTTFPKSLIQTKQQKEQPHQIVSHKRRRTLHGRGRGRVRHLKLHGHRLYCEKKGHWKAD